MTLMRFRGKHKYARERASYDQFSDEGAGIDAFIDRHSEHFVTSATAWQQVGKTMGVLRDDSGIRDAMHIGVRNAFELANITNADVRVERETDRLLNQLSIFTQIVARAEARRRKGLKQAITSGLLVTRHLPATNVAHILQSKDFPKIKFSNAFLGMQESIAQADAISDQVLEALCEQYAVTPDDILELASMYENGAEEAFPVLGELRNMITADWHRLDPERSILRQHCQRLAEDPGLHVGPFCEAVTARDTLQTVATMARYAIVSAGGSDLSDAAVEHQLHSTHSDWHQIPDLENAFNDYIGQVGVSIEGAFKSIAGPRHLKNIRLEHSDHEIMECAAEMEVWGASNGEEARQNARQRSVNTRSRRKPDRRKLGSDTLPTAQESIRQLDASELLEQRGVKFARYANGRGYELADVSDLTPQVLVERFKLEPDQVGIGDDMLAVVEYLRQPSHSYRGVRRLEKEELKLDGKRRSLWRFAPDKTPGLKIRSNNRFYRVIYTIVDGDVVLYDMLSHADFDKKYKI